MEPEWGVERNALTGLQCWSRLDRSPQQKSVRFKCDVEVREYLAVKGENDDWFIPRSWTSEPYRLQSEKEKAGLLLAASLAVIAFTLTYKWWLFIS